MGAGAADEEILLTSLAERRLALRVPATLEVTLRDGLRARAGELLDLSLSGARLRFREPVTADGRPWLWLPAGLGGRFGHPIGAEVAWTDSLSGSPTGHCQVGLRFRRFPFRGRARLERALLELLARASDAREIEPPEERRRSQRVPYARRVIARGVGTPLVLLGRDLSANGLCIETRRALAVGDRLQIALHAGDRVPLVVHTEVVRAAGREAWVLAFRDLSAVQRERIDSLVREAVTPHFEASALLVSEVRE